MEWLFIILLIALFYKPVEFTKCLPYIFIVLVVGLVAWMGVTAVNHVYHFLTNEGILKWVAVFTITLLLLPFIIKILAGIFIILFELVYYAMYPIAIIIIIFIGYYVYVHVT